MINVFLKFFNYLTLLMGAFFLLSNLSNIVLAGDVPRFVTTKFNEVNARTGPAKNCPIEWVFISKNEPVEVITEYDQWRKIRDVDGEGGWVHSSLLSLKRSVIIRSKKIHPLLKNPDDHSVLIAKLEPNLRCDLIKCFNTWCMIKCNNHKGWVYSKYLWGVYPEDYSKVG